MKRIPAIVLSVSSALLLFTGTVFAAEDLPAVQAAATVFMENTDPASEEITDITPLEETSQEYDFQQEINETVAEEVEHGLYMPDVTPEMSKASYWAEKEYFPDEILADYDQICAINDTVLHSESTKMYDLKNWPYETFNGEQQNELNLSSATDNAKYAFNNGAKFDKEGNKYSTWDEAEKAIYGAMIENAVDPNAEEEMPVRYAICTSRTCLQILPTDHPLWDDYTDPDFGYLWQSAVRVNEPLIVKTRSADGLYYLAISSNSSGWVPAADIAICEDREEWLAAWDLPQEKTVVVYDDKIYTEESYYAPETANRMLTMGTVLPLAEKKDWKDNLVINRRAYNNYVVWLPVRNDDGSYRKVLGLIGENRKVQVGYLPLTTSNVLSVMMNQLGDTYGWGGMLLSNDCSGYVRDVYKCFGLELARNTNWQAAQPVYRVDLSAMDDETKAARISELPPGTALYFSGHAMIYLGEENGKLYVISSVSDLRPDADSAVLRVRGALINTLDVRRGNQTTWLRNLHTAIVPYYTADHVITHPLFGECVSIADQELIYNGKPLTPAVSVQYKNCSLEEGTDYTVSCSDNINAGEASFTVTGIGKYSGEVYGSFTINKAANPLAVKAKAPSVKYSKLKSKNQTLAISKVLKFTNAGQGTKTYAKSSGNKKITINKKTGKITIKKGLKKGTYTIKIKVSAAGNGNYKAAAKTVTVRIKVK